MENGHVEQTSAGPTLQAIKYSRGKLELLDQRKLPHESIYLDIPDTAAAWHAIKDMVVRGAPAIAIAAALALAVELVKKQEEFDSAAAVQTHVRQQLDYLVSSRPTAVNLSDAAEKLKKLASDAAGAASASASAVVEAVVAEAEKMLEDDVASNKRIGRFGADAIIAAVQKSRGKKQQQQQNGSTGTSGEGLRVMTHCNTGSLATAAFGTALGVIRTLYADGALKKAICTETRPYNQGSRLTAFELVHDGIPATLIADSAAAYLQSSGGVDAIVVGADRVAANGDTANKVGTFSLALSAFHHGIPFFVAAPLTSVDTAIPSGEHIVVEERDPKELTHALGGQGPQVAPNGIGVWNPSFDITPARVITGIITEQGVISKPQGSDEFDIPAFVRGLKVDNTATPAAAAAAAPKFTSFEPLSEEKVVQYLQSRPDLAKRLGGLAESWTSKEVGDGNINFVYIVKGPEGSLVLKQALPYIRCVGESWPMTLERIGFEAAALQEEYRVVPQHVPEVYSYDRPMAAVAMEFLPPPHIILRKGLISGLVYPHLSDHVSTFLAHTLFATSLLNVSTTTFRQEVARYCRNVEMCRLTEQVIFTEPYTLAKNNRWTSPQLDDDAKAVREDTELKVAVAELKTKFCEKAEALIHADLHTGSIMATPESTKVIDPEFAFYGPMGFDIGAFLGNLLLAYFSQDGHAKQTSENRTDFKRWLLSAIVATWTLFEDKFVDLWTAAAKEDRLGDLYPGAVFASPLERIAAQKAYMRTLLSDSLGFAGAKMIRRIVGIAHVEDMESIEDADERAKCERQALNFGKRLVKERSAFDGIAAVAAAAAAALE